MQIGWKDGRKDILDNVPFDEGFEKAVLVSILSDPSLLPRIQQIVSEGDFFKAKNQEIFRAINEIDLDSVDSLTVKDRLSDSTKEYFRELVENSDAVLPSLTNAIYYAETIRSKSKLRRGIDLGREIIAACYQPNANAEDAVQQLEDMFSKFLRQRIQTTDNVSTRERFQAFVDSLGKRTEESKGVRTGFFEIDKYLHHLKGLTILAGKTSSGKSCLAVNIARNVAANSPVLFFSLEQTQEQVFERILSADSGVHLEEIVTGNFFKDRESVTRIRDSKENLLPVMNNLHIDDRSNVNSKYISSVSRQKFFELGSLGLIIVDYLHIMDLGERSMVESLGIATRDLRSLGKELNCPVILLSQLSRQPDATGKDEERRLRRPELSDLRSSGEIEQVADVVLFLFRESYYNYTGYIPEDDEVEIIIRKNRQGKTGTGTLIWNPKIQRYRDLI